ncbi:MAG TPA: hypothetical protein VFV34_11255 [Blastocatellia bacterium]|nr:hypothetical protein [Blastocatellia bacterium]
MRFYWFTLAVLCVWRITHLLSSEDGPWDLIFRLRQRAGTGFFATLLDCFYCLSLWVAAPFALIAGDHWTERLLLWPALSGAAILIERTTSARAAPATALYFEEEGDSTDVVLRKQETTDPPGNHNSPG